MKCATHIITAKPFTALPKEYHHQGEPSAWAKMTRPGQAMHSFLESMFFDDRHNIWLSDVPYGRVFRVTPDGSWELMHQIKGELHAMRFSPDEKTIGVDYKHGLIALKSKDTFEVLSTGLAGQEFKGLSDMAYAPDGTLWFTDSGRTSLNDPHRPSLSVITRQQLTLSHGLRSICEWDLSLSRWKMGICCGYARQPNLEIRV